MLDPMTKRQAFFKAESFRDRVSQIYLARDVARAGWSRYNVWKHKRIMASRFFISVEEDDYVYDELKKWLLEDDIDRHKSVVAETERTYVDGEHIYKLELYAHTDFEDDVFIGNTPVHVEITTRKPGESRSVTSDPVTDWLSEMMGGGGDGDVPESASGRRSSSSAYSMMRLPERIIFTVKSREERDIVFQHLTTMMDRLEKRQPTFKTATGYGGWKTASTVLRRPLDSVILQGDAMDRVVEDMDKFLSQEERYIELGLPWHRGYLFHGPPGTGKTSLASSLASHFGLDVYYIPLSSINSDTNLMECVNSVDSRKALMVLEDIDIVSASRTRTDENKGITLQGLLNALDGIATPHGLITAMTTNNVSVLDYALIRPGRVDFSLEIGYATNDQVHRLCERFTGRRFDLPELHAKVTPAEIVGIFKDGEGNMERRLREFIEEANITTIPVSDDVQTSSN